MRVRISTEADRASALMHPGIRGRDALSMSVNTPIREAAAEFLHGIRVIDGGCPCMFEPAADVGHKAMRVILTLNGHVSRKVG